MALCTDAAMVLYYDIDGNTADHDYWHSYEHMHERLSIPGFVRATRWVATSAKPRYLVVYEVESVDIASSADYLARLNDPSPWTTSMMPRFRGMIRGFCTETARSGYGLGHNALSIRFTPTPGREAELGHWLANDVIPGLSLREGMAGVSLLQPAAKPPMTKEQSIRGPDAELPWILLATAYDAAALDKLNDETLSLAQLQQHGCSSHIETGLYQLHYTLSAEEALRSPANPAFNPDSPLS